MNGEIPSEISIMQPSFQLIGLAPFQPVMIQRKFVKEDAAKQQDKELQNEIDKQQRFADDNYGRGRYMQPDILTQAAIEERQYYHRESYNLNLQTVIECLPFFVQNGRGQIATPVRYPTKG